MSLRQKTKKGSATKKSLKKKKIATILEIVRVEIDPVEKQYAKKIYRCRNSSRRNSSRRNKTLRKSTSNIKGKQVWWFWFNGIYKFSSSNPCIWINWMGLFKNIRRLR